VNVLRQVGNIPRFGERIKIKPQDIFKDFVTLAKSSSVGGVAVPLAATAMLGTGTGTVGTALQTGGTGLSSTGPQSSAAKSTLDSMAAVGSGGAANWSVAHPSLGGLAQFVVGSILSSANRTSSDKKMKEPN